MPTEAQRKEAPPKGATEAEARKEDDGKEEVLMRSKCSSKENGPKVSKEGDESMDKEAGEESGRGEEGKGTAIQNSKR